MQLIRHWQKAAIIQPTVFSIGNFDGVHIGHQHVISRLQDYAKNKHCQTGLMIFEPQPLEFFQQDKAPSRLTNFSEKYALLKRLGLDYLCCFRFDEKFAAICAKEFVEKILLEALHVKALVVGDDFRFGAKRQGDLNLLKSYASQIEVITQSNVCQNTVRVSSSLIREALKAGDFQKAEQMLGRRYSVSGCVIQGDKRARTIGVPTANIRLSHQVLPLQGVFCVEVLCDKTRYFAIANMGVRPTVGGRIPLLEVHLFSETPLDLYGKHLEVFFDKKLREEKRFDTFEALQIQILEDVRQAKAHWHLV